MVTTILQIITISITALLGALNVYMALSMNKSKQIVDIVAKQRLIFLEQYRLLTAEIMATCDCNSILLQQDKEFFYTLSLKVHKFKNLFKGVYWQEKELIEETTKVHNLAIKFFNEHSDENKHDLSKQLERFFFLINIYDLAYWRFIINQADGTHIKPDDFDAFYEKAKREYTKENNIGVSK